ncbi:MAG TPA: helix-turn-helix domain-containing protein [Nocardioidaceae bacterium]|nr:helix-turn-helix domain-containing protein [Nocardioidaceae bacterium]
MTTPTNRPDDGVASRLGPTRARALALLRDADTPLSADEVADRLGLHTNTARFHLDALTRDGLAVRSTEGRDRPGRPHALFAAAPTAPDTTRRSYRLLAEILTSYLMRNVPDPDAAARDAGFAWGRYLAPARRPGRRLAAAEAVQVMVDQLDHIGFESHSDAGPEGTVLEINHCPFLELASEHRDVVCSVHLGLMRGLLTQLEAPIEAAELLPLVEPSRCIARLRPTG